MPNLNELAHELANAMAADADELGLTLSTLDCGTRIIDCGVKAPGSVEAGRRLAELSLSGLGRVEFIDAVPKIWNGQFVNVSTESPVAACLASQYAGWEIKGDGFFAMGSGPMRAAACREKLFGDIGHCEKPKVCVGVLETSKLPADSVCINIAEKCEISPDRLTLCIARTSSPAGMVQIVARSVETALHKLHELGFNLNQIEAGYGSAPIPPLCDDNITAIGRTNDAILYGACVMLFVDCESEDVERIADQVPSCASRDYGRPFGEIFSGYDNDFYRIDPMLFSPAVVRIKNTRTGINRYLGDYAPEILAKSFAKK
jgi:methenyltetrahydromethanopterin cyclohydrolase